MFDPDGKLIPAKDLPGAVPMLASAGSVLVMSECTLHTGLPKTTVPVRSNLYYNYMETNSMNPMSRAPYFGYSECGKLCAFSGVSMAQSWFDFPRRLCIACTRSSTIVSRGAGTDTLDGVGTLGPLKEQRCLCRGMVGAKNVTKEWFIYAIMHLHTTLDAA